MDPLRILHVTPYFEEAWAYGGIPRAVTALARAQVRRGHQVTVATTDVRDRQSRMTMEQGAGDGPAVQVFRNVSNRLAYDLQLFLPRGLSAFLSQRAASFDAIHAHALHNVPTVLAARAAARAGRLFLLQPHGTAPLIERRQLAKWLFDHTVARGLVRRVSRWLALTEVERRDLIALGVSAETIRITPAPVELTEFTPDLLALPKSPTPQIAYLGRLSPRKRVDLLVAAFAMLPDKSARLVIAGPDMGSEPGLRQQVNRLRLRDRVTFASSLPGRTRLQLLASSQLVAYPANDEALGLVPLEALLCGTPVVVADDSGCGATVSRLGGGQVFPVGNERAMTEAMVAILVAPEVWRERALLAADAIRMEFSADAVAARVDDVMAELL